MLHNMTTWGRTLKYYSLNRCGSEELTITSRFNDSLIPQIQIYLTFYQTIKITPGLSKLN